MPDLILDPSSPGTVIEELVFDDDSCAVGEGCVQGTGRRRLLRFDTFTANIGSADVFVGAVPPPEESSEIHDWSECHGHHHFRTYATYELLTSDLCCAAAEGHKQPFCLIDLARYDPTSGGDAPVYNCSYQGIQRGWEDAYTSGIECQWIDVTDVPPGDYYLRIRINVDHLLPESRYDNNELTMPVRIGE